VFRDILEGEVLPKVLVVDDDKGVLDTLRIILTEAGHNVVTTPDPVYALNIIELERPDVVVEDIRMPEMDGIELLRRIKSRWPKLPVVIITAFSTWENAVQAMRLGAFDYIKKPFDINQLRVVVARAAAAYDALKAGRKPFFEVGQIVGASEGMKTVLDVVERVAPTDTTVLILGESGTGKELVARAIHMKSLRYSEPFIAVNCAAFPETLLESELFGYKKGAFTGATSDKAGLFEVAHKGTLFLDEVAEIPLPTQAKLLRAIEEREFYRLGDTSPRQVDVRLIAATKQPLEERVREGTFREDLFYRLNVIPITIPPLRERRSDIPLLAGHFLRKYAKQMGKDIEDFEPAAIEKLMSHSWPGNVRELENAIQRAVAFCNTKKITKDDIFITAEPLETKTPPIPENFNLDAYIEEVDRSFVEAALRQAGGSVQEAAKLLGISVRALRYRISKYRL